jgi:hypothetical protein
MSDKRFGGYDALTVAPYRITDGIRGLTAVDKTGTVTQSDKGIIEIALEIFPENGFVKTQTDKGILTLIL